MHAGATVRNRRWAALLLAGPILILCGGPRADDAAVNDAGNTAEQTALATNNCGPQGDLRGDAERGAPVHKAWCAECHGEDGKAEVIIMHMDEPPPDQSDPEYLDKLPDSYLYLAICRGGPGVGKSYVMSAWGDFLSDQQIRDLVAFVRTFPESSGNP